MNSSTERRTGTDQTRDEQASRAAGRAAGYCWVANPYGPGRCTWPPHSTGRHKDVYAHTEWTQTPAASSAPTEPAAGQH